jgi:outer membrane protein OmpA-like peptidoglycan-associated protein/Tol biopolymer transport system component
MKRIIWSFTLLTIASFSLFSQSGKLKKANTYYEKLSYKLAIENYSDLLNTDFADRDLKSKLAFSYYNVSDLVNAEKYYSEAIRMGELSNEHYFYYSQTLKQNGKYAESDKIMNLFYEKSNSDKRAVSFVNNRTYLEKIEKEGIHFTISGVDFNSIVSDFGGYQYSKSNEVYFISSRRNTMVKNNWMWNGGNFLDLFSVKNEKASVPKLISKISTTFHEGPLCFNADESMVFFTRNNISKGKNRRDLKGIQNLKLYAAKVDENGKWIDEKETTLNSKDYSIGHPAISNDGKTIYFASDMPGGFGGADLYMANLTSDGTIGKPINLGKDVNTEGQEMFPWISPDGLLFFSSNGHIGLGGLDVFVMSIDNDGKSFGNLTNVGKPLNSQNDDFALSFNKDGKSGYFSSNRIGGKGDDDIYSFQLTRPFLFKIKIIGTVLDQESKHILAGSTVYLKDSNGAIISSIVADENGNYSFDVEPNKEFVIIAQNKDYSENRTTIQTSPNSGSTIKADVELVKTPQIGLIGTISDNKTGQLLDGVNIKIIDKKTGEVIFDGATAQKGDFMKELSKNKVNDQLNYTITLSKTGYLTKSLDFNYKIEKAGLINLNEKLDVSLGKVEIGVDLSSLINIKPIYFDLGKYVIRKDAAIELDKIVKVMNEYPSMQIELGSHTDCRSSIASNLKLSDNRAKASADYIKKRISNPQRIYGKGYGESKLKVDCPCEGTVKSNCSEEEHQKNRRTEFIIIKM